MLSLRRLLLSAAVAAAMPVGAFAECGPRPTNLCEHVNDGREIFIGRILSVVPDNPLEWRMHVTRSFRGTAKGDVVVQVWSHGDLPSLTDLTIGESYLFYVSTNMENGVLTRSTPLACGDWLPVSAVPRDELAFLARLNSASNDGRVFGTLEHVDAATPQPLPGVRISLNDGKKSYSGTTDRTGAFDIRGLPAGEFHVSTSIPSTMLVEIDAESTIELAAHGCYEAELMARINTTINGRITLPPGVKVVGTAVSALTPSGTIVKTIDADPEGRYTIPGLPPGEYVVGINVSKLAPGIEAPFLPTYAPGTTDISQAKRISFDGPAAIAGVDVRVQVAEIVSIAVKAHGEDGRPVVDSPLSLETSGGSRGVGRTDANGATALRIVRGVRAHLTGGALGIGCMSPLLIGPDAYPATLDLIYSLDGCREAFNLSEFEMLENSVHGAIGGMPVRVTFPDGSPAYKAQVSISSRSSRPYAAGFQTDKDGRVDMPAPADQEFTIQASFHDGGANCLSSDLLFNTERGIRFQLQTDPKARPNWDDVPVSTGEIHLFLLGSSCRSPSP